MDWFKKHVDTVIVLGGILTSMLWINTKFNEIDRRLIKIETVMVVKGIMPTELAQNSKAK